MSSKPKKQQAEFTKVITFPHSVLGSTLYRKACWAETLSHWGLRNVLFVKRPHALLGHVTNSWDYISKTIIFSLMSSWSILDVSTYTDKANKKNHECKYLGWMRAFIIQSCERSYWCKCRWVEFQHSSFLVLSRHSEYFETEGRDLTEK